MLKFKQPLTKARIARVKALRKKIDDGCIANLRNGPVFAYSDRWSGLRCNGIGSGDSDCSVFNNPSTTDQITLVLALSEHQLLEKIVELPLIRERSDKDRNRYREWITAIENEKVLQGMKVLDIGCGLKPAFARSTRILGADVHTVDFYSSDKFEVYHGNESYRSSFTPEQRIIEVERHIQLDLRSENAFAQIKERTGGEFDFVTASHVDDNFLKDGKGYSAKEIKPPEEYMKQMIGLLLTEYGIGQKLFMRETIYRKNGKIVDL